MPTLKQIACQLEKEPSLAPLKEYSTNYGDGIVETFVAIPDAPCAFGIHLTSSGYIAPGLGVYVFMDGVYQCNRLRRSLMVPDGTITPEFYEVDFRFRQKEEKLESGGRFLGREWRFEKLNISDADAAPNVDDTILGNIGTIEVVVLRLHEDQSEAMMSTPEPASAEQAKATPPKTKPARNERARVEPQRTGQHANKKNKGVAVKASFLRRQPGTDGRGIFDGAEDDPDDDNFGAAFDGPSERRFHDRNYYHYEGDDRAHQSRHSHRRRVSPSPPPRSDYGPSYADYLRWKDSHPDAAAYRGRDGERQRATSYYEEYRPGGREGSRDPRQHDDLRASGRHHQRRRARAEDGIPLTKERSFWTFDSSNGDIDTLPDHRRGHSQRSSCEIRVRDGVPISESQESYGTSTELEATRRPRAAEELAASRLHSAIDSATPPRARPIYKVRHAHFQDGYPGDGRPKGNPFLPVREYVSDEFSQPLFNINDHPHSSFRRNEPDASLASSHRGPDPRYNPRYPPAPLQHYEYTPDVHSGNSKMPGGWEDPYDAAATPNPFATRFVDQNETGSPTHRAVSNPQVISTRWDKDDQQDQGSKGSHRSNNSNKSHRSHNSSRHSGRKIADEAKTSGAALNNQNSVWGARGDNNGGQDGGWDSGFNNDGAQSNSWDTNNEPKSGGNQGWDGNSGGNSSGWDNPKEQKEGGQQNGGADAGDQQNAGSGDQWSNNNASNDAGNSNWNNPTENDNAGATKSEWNNDSSGNQDRGGWNSTFENNQADSTKDQNKENKSSSSSTNDPWPDLDNTANQEDTNNWDISVDNTANQEDASKWNDTRDKTAQQTNTGNWDTPADASAQKTSGNWDVQPIVPAGANTSGSRKGSKAVSKAASDSTGSFMHRPAVLEQPYVKGYWKDWSQPRSTPRVPQPQPHAPNAPDDATDIYSPSEVPYVVPEETAREKAVNQYVHAGKGFNYSHITARPKYMDSLEQPYAIFRFKYRSRDILGKILGRRTKAVIDQDAEQEKVEERKRRLSELSKEELVQQVLQNSNVAGESQKAGSQKAESQMVGSQKAPSCNLPPIPEKPPSVSKWVDSVAGATTEGQQSSDGPGTCNRCQKDLPSEYWHCNICDSGDYDLCCHCVVDKKLRCSDDSHELAKWKEDMDLGNGMKGVKPTGEILPPVAKSSAGKKGGSRSGGDNNNWAPDAGVPSGGNTGNWGVESGTAGPAGNTGVDQWTADTATTANAGTGATGKVGNW